MESTAGTAAAAASGAARTTTAAEAATVERGPQSDWRAPSRLASPSPVVSADVVVIGGGGAGLAAAITARTLGREVVLLEKTGKLGGSTGRSIGSISATSTPHQIRKGILDTPDEHFDDLGKFNAGTPAEDNLALRRLLVDNVNDSLRWLMSIGVDFFGPTPEPPHRKPRMHNVLPNSGAYIYHLGRNARRTGVDVRLERRCTDFVVEQGRVCGVDCVAADGSTERYLARGGVVLASGDYSASPEFKDRWGKPGAAEIGATNPTNTGDGHAMAMRLGARVINGHLLSVLVRFVPPPRRHFVHALPPWRVLTSFMSFALEHLPARLLRPFVMSFLTTVLAVTPKLFQRGAILVNKRGERFADELQSPVYPLAKQPGQIGYIIIDARIARQFSAYPDFVSTAPGIGYAYIPDYERSRPDIVRKAGSLAELARKAGIDPARLAETVSQRNAAVREAAARGDDSAPESRFLAVETPPFYALGPVRSYVNLTDGGLAINDRLQVLDQDDQPIPGLFAAGSAGQGGMLLEGHGHHLGWAFTSGRIAGRLAAYGATSPAAVATVEGAG